MESSYEKIGRVTHFYPKASVAIVELISSLKKGDKILVRGSTTKIEQIIDSMESEHAQVLMAEPGKPIGVRVNGRVRENDIVYRVKS
jgi:translation elongation factor EF-1alpha